MRGALDLALKKRDPDEVMAILETVHWKITDERYMETMGLLFSRILSMYGAALIEFKRMWRKVELIEASLRTVQTEIPALLEL